MTCVERRGRFPAGTKLSNSSGHRLFSAGPAFSPETMRLPYLDQSMLFNSINSTDVPLGPPGVRWATALSPSNSTALNFPLAVFHCPSDTPLVRPGNSYRACTGSHPHDVGSGLTPKGGDGAFPALRSFPAAQFVDGLSSTVGFSERLIGSGDQDAAPSVRDVNFRDPPGGPIPDADQFLKICARESGPDLGFARSGAYWLASGYEDGLYNHVLGPNAVVVDCTTAPPSLPPGMMYLAALTARSQHRGGVGALHMDGSVHFIKNSVALPVWRALATRAGGEVISSDQY